MVSFGVHILGVVTATRRVHLSVLRRVPLNKIAKAILKKYPNLPDNMLLPFLRPQDYNSYIRRVFTKVGITRKVSWRNPLTGKEEKRPTNEIASSHMPSALMKKYFEQKRR